MRKILVTVTTLAVLLVAAAPAVQGQTVTSDEFEKAYTKKIQEVLVIPKRAQRTVTFSKYATGNSDRTVVVVNPDGSGMRTITDSEHPGWKATTRCTASKKCWTSFDGGQTWRADVGQFIWPLPPYLTAAYWAGIGIEDKEAVYDVSKNKFIITLPNSSAYDDITFSTVFTKTTMRTVITSQDSQGISTFTSVITTVPSFKVVEPSPDTVTS